MNLKQYQRKAVDELIQHTANLLTNPVKKKRLVIKSPTASGKTVMLSSYMEEVGKKTKEDVCFLWISIGNGGLHKQSRDSISFYLEGSPPCRLLEDVIQDGIIKQNEIVVVNWESLSGKKGGLDWYKVFMRDGEKTNFGELMKATNKKRKIILVVDESHHTMDSETSQDLIDMIQPDIMVEASATPKTIPSVADANANRGQYVEVDYNDVIKEGMVKKEIWINDNIDKMDLTKANSLQLVVDMALEKRNELKEAFLNEGKNINPLLLIQIPNAKDGEETLSELMPYLKEKGYSLKEGNVAIWTSNQEENTAGIKQLHSPVDILIFKMAVATGWDCPRSHILVKLRESKSEVFDIQTIGRILRMPEQSHYGHECLNLAYIYTNNPSIEVRIENLSIVKTLQSRLKEDIQNVSLLSEYMESKQNTTVRTSLFDQVFTDVAEQVYGFKPEDYAYNQEQIKKYGWSEDTKSLVNVFAKGKIDYVDINASSVTDSATTTLKRYDIEKRFNQLLLECSPRFDGQIKRLVYAFFDLYVGSFVTDIGYLLELVLINEENLFKPFLTTINKRYLEQYKELVSRDNLKQIRPFSIPPFVMKDEDKYELFPADYYAHSKCYLRKDRSHPERDFEAFLEKQGDRIKWWYKNEDKGKDAFSILYQYDGKDHLFYPDYIVFLKTGLVGLYETKAENDQDATTKTKAKAEALQRYLKETNGVTGGIVIPKNGVVYINEMEEYDHKQTYHLLINSKGFN